MGIANTLRDLADESNVNSAERVSLLEIAKEWKNLELENKRLTQYKDFVNSKIDRREMPWPYTVWIETVEELAKQLEQAAKEGQ